jgi:hypothetical protein
MQEGIRPVVWVSYKNERCVSCGASLDRGDLILMNREQGIRCLTCAGLGGLVLLPAGDVALTRRALAHSARSAVVVKHSRARHRNERQGVLVEESAIERAESENAQDEARREAQRQERRVRDQVAEQSYVADFAARVLELFPGAPPAETKAIAARACEKYSGRVGRSRRAKALDEQAILLAVRAHIRHAHTEYDRLLAKGMEPAEARAIVRPAIEKVLAGWMAAGSR